MVFKVLAERGHHRWAKQARLLLRLAKRILGIAQTATKQVIQGASKSLARRYAKRGSRESVAQYGMGAERQSNLLLSQAACRATRSIGVCRHQRGRGADRATGRGVPRQRGNGTPSTKTTATRGQGDERRTITGMQAHQNADRCDLAGERISQAQRRMEAQTK